MDDRTDVRTNQGSTERSNERTVWFNGKFVPESRALVPYRDRSFLFGDGAFDLTRTFNHRIFKLDEHVDRLYASLRALRLDPTMEPEAMKAITREVVERNRHLLAEGEDWWVGQRISRGVMKVAGDNWDHYGPTVVVECLPMPVAERAHLFESGVQVVTPSVRRTPPEALTPRTKSHNYLNLIMGDLEVRAQNPDGWAILLDMQGNFCEGLGSNIFLVRGGEVLTPRAKNVLPGVSRETAMELARGLGLPVRETDLDLYDAYNADEAFITSTSLCICPVASINGVAPAAGAYGPVTRRLIAAYVDFVGCDFVAQYLAKLG
ncbi:branched-chain-amino-acid transaminase [Paralimibaculum aggregatum]|uniref:Probable branched-chain-amino-acid aminotransferase n=1 Tax=Paralimibaculum aggregatum TaxID=3036245 RepID=A0ABQ6LPG3_9RHOB|nr:aminotransferase class IV [Limibaculum sp. NKW23]GMG84215.1 branched-chain-amino-acid transaminase [Limibaculum sp. NKW23]